MRPLSESESERIAAWLRVLPRGATIRWGENHALLAGAHHGWVDVAVPAICDALDLNWVWTIEGPDDADGSPDDPTVIELDYDLHVWAVWDPDRRWYLEGALAEPAGTTVDLTPLERLAGEKPGRGIQIVPAWSSDRIGRALTDWADRYAGRGDLRFEFDRSIHSPMIDQLDEVMEAVEAGDAATYEIGPRVQVTDQVMDTLLEMDPDEAAELTERILDTIRNFTERRHDG